MITVKAFDKNDFNEMCPDGTDAQFLNTRIEVLSRIRTNLVQKIAEIDTKLLELKRDGAGVPLQH